MGLGGAGTHLPLPSSSLRPVLQHLLPLPLPFFVRFWSCRSKLGCHHISAFLSLLLLDRNSLFWCLGLRQVLNMLRALDTGVWHLCIHNIFRRGNGFLGHEGSLCLWAQFHLATLQFRGRWCGERVVSSCRLVNHRGVRLMWVWREMGKEKSEKVEVRGKKKGG